MTEEVEKVKSRWDEAYEGDHAEQSALRNIYTLASPLYWSLYGNACFGNTGREYGWLSWLVRVYGSPKPRRLLELGSGNGDLILDLAALGFADTYTGLDVSEVAVEVARKKAAQAGFTHVTFEPADLNQLELARGAYDIVLAQMTIHHVEQLEHLYGEVASALRPGGVFAINEYVGPTRWQFTWGQLMLANALLLALPRRLRRRPDGEIKRGLRRPRVADMLALDPSEAVRSREIYPLFRKHFALEHAIDFGGSVSILVLDTIIANFEEDDREAVRWLRFILRVDHWARRLRLVPTINRVLAGRPRR